MEKNLEQELKQSYLLTINGLENIKNMVEFQINQIKNSLKDLEKKEIMEKENNIFVKNMTDNIIFIDDYRLVDFICKKELLKKVSIESLNPLYKKGYILDVNKEDEILEKKVEKKDNRLGKNIVDHYQDICNKQNKEELKTYREKENEEELEDLKPIEIFSNEKKDKNHEKNIQFMKNNNLKYGLFLGDPESEKKFEENMKKIKENWNSRFDEKKKTEDLNLDTEKKNNKTKNIKTSVDKDGNITKTISSPVVDKTKTTTSKKSSTRKALPRTSSEKKNTNKPKSLLNSNK